MAGTVRIHKGKAPPPSAPRIHYILEWAHHRKVKQADISRALDVEKSTVSRWFAGSIPVEEHLIRLAAFLQADEPAALFRHPDDDWLARFFRQRAGIDRKRAIDILKAAFGEAA
jgi:transcriptional regulator with XRE-family HTH domain